MSSVSAALTQTSKEFASALSAQTSTGNNMDKEDFLLLLVTQFQYQDPLNPMEDQEFVAQMAQFSSLEQLMNLNTSMEGLTDATENQQMVNATSYIGKQVSVTGNKIGKVTDADGHTTVSTFRYAFGDNVKEGILTVMDGNGNAVYTETLAGKAANATFEFNWTGLNDKGQVAPDGTYTVSLAAYNSAGESVLSDQVVDATVTSVITENDTVYIGLDGGQLMELANVRQVSVPKNNVTDSTKKTTDQTKTTTATNSSGQTLTVG
ncbi:MAG: flagellar hook assembly protein FlgD [Desulfovibrionaceae bacterium]|nr:flagellar hook assembly protein FlgD [Desulfovibrionaceae bacterium]